MGMGCGCHGDRSDAAGHWVPRGAQQGLRGPQLGPVTNWDKQGVRAGPFLCPAGCAGAGAPRRFGNTPAPSPATQGQLEGHRLKKRGEAQHLVKIQSDTLSLTPPSLPLCPSQGSWGWFGDMGRIRAH